MAQTLKQSTAVDVLIGPFVDILDGATSETGESPTVKLSKNGQALGAKSDATTPVSDADGYYNCELDATDTNTVGTMILTVAASATALPIRHEFQVMEEAVYDALFASSAAAFDANQRVDVGSWLGTAVTTSGTTAKPEVDVFGISDDATAANNAELMYDGTGYTADDSAPASRSQVNAIGAASGGSINVEATEDNTGGAIDPSSAAFVGSVQSGTFASTEAEDAVLHDIDDTANDIDVVYGFSVGGGRSATEISFAGFVQGNADEMKIKAYDHVGADWEIIGTIIGSNGTTNVSLDLPLLLKHTGTGAELGKTYIRFETDSTTPSNLSVDKLLVSAVNIGQTIGYALGAVWVDTNASNTNTESFVDGVADNPVSTWAAALTISAATGINRFEVAAGSSITLTASSDNFVINGRGVTVALAGQSVSGAVFIGATITGNDDGTNGTATTYLNCIMGESVLGLHKLEWCGLGGTTAGITLNEAGTFDWDRCFSQVAGTGTPKATFKTAVNQNLNMRHYSGGIQVEAMGDGASTDNMSLEGWGQFVEGTCTAGTVAIRGNQTVSGIANLTLSDDARIDVAQINSEVDTGISDAALATAANLATMSTNVDQIETAVITNAAGADIAADIIALKAETVLIVADTGELQSDWVNGGRLDLLLDAVLLDTGTTIPGTITTMSANVDQIETAVITNAAGVDIAADIIAMKAETALIVADTNELQTDDVPGLIAALNNPSVSDILTTAMTESYAAQGATITVAQGLYGIQQFLMDSSNSSVTRTTEKLDQTTTAMTFTMDSASQPTSIERTT